MPPSFTKRNILNLAHYFPYDVKLRLLAHSRSFLANQKARNAIVGAENLLTIDSSLSFDCHVENLCKNLASRIGVLSKIRALLALEAAIVVL